MELKYLGHSSFRMKFKNGMVLLTDPFDPDYVGLPFPKQKTDLVTMSCSNKDHNFAAGLSGPVKREEIFIIDEEGEYEVGGTEIKAVKTFNSKNKNGKKEDNLVMLIRSNGITTCHLGDLKNALSEKQIERIGPIDVLLVPVGGEDSMDPKEASELVANMSPSVVIPMHYKIRGMGSGFEKLKEVNEFLDKSSLEVMLEGVDKVRIDTTTLPENTKIMVLKP